MHLKSVVLFCGILAVTSALYDGFVTDTSNNDQVVQSEAKQLEHLETSKKLEDLLARMEHLEAREKSREKAYLHEIQNLRRQILTQTRRTASLECLVRRLSNKSPEHLNQKMDETDAAKSQDDRNGEMKSAKIKYCDEVHTQRIRRAENENYVAFFATIGAQHLTHMGARQPITFDNIITNIGNAYHSHTGFFIAPVSGTYVFSTTLFAFNHESYHAQFSKNGQAITTMYLSGSETSGYDTSSQTIILELQKGDDVCVHNTDSDKSVYGYSYSLFSGFLLQEDISSSVVVGK